MDEEIKKSIKELSGNFKEFKDFVVKNVVLKSDLDEIATKTDLQEVKNEVTTKLDKIMKNQLKQDQSELVINHRLGNLEAKA